MRGRCSQELDVFGRVVLAEGELVDLLFAC